MSRTLEVSDETYDKIKAQLGDDDSVEVVVEVEVKQFNIEHTVQPEQDRLHDGM